MDVHYPLTLVTIMRRNLYLLSSKKEIPDVLANRNRKGPNCTMASFFEYLEASFLHALLEVIHNPVIVIDTCPQILTTPLKRKIQVEPIFNINNPIYELQRNNF